MIEINFIHLKPHVQSVNQLNWAASLSLNNPKFYFILFILHKNSIERAYNFKNISVAITYEHIL
jgi:hypothetical protein